MPPRRCSLRLAASLAIALLAVALSGCLERIESITVSPDGSAVLRSEFRGTPDDFKKSADALPEVAGSWAISQRDEKDAEGKPRIIRVAELSVGAGAGLPGSYAEAADPRAASALRFPTSIRVSRAGDRTTCEFSRTYARRAEADYTYLRRKLTDNDAFKAIDGKDPSTLTTEQRTLLIRTAARMEADKVAHFIGAGASTLEADGSWPQEIGLLLRQTAFDHADHFDITKAESLLAQPPSRERDTAATSMAAAFIEGLHRAVLDALTGLPVTEDQRQRFIAAAKAEKALRDATEDLKDEHWEVRITMPGTVVAHNADRVENGVLIWEFTADAFLDRDQPLRATSWIGVPGASPPGRK